MTLEEYLTRHVEAESSFSVHDVARVFGVETKEASGMIQEYLHNQRQRRSSTLYVLRREAGTRTTKARWRAGIRAKDARQIGYALYDDIRRKITRAYAPDLVRLATLNPAAARVARSQIDAIINGTMVQLQAVVSVPLNEAVEAKAAAQAKVGNSTFGEWARAHS